MTYSEIFAKYIENYRIKNDDSKSLIVVLGSLADFDSFEYVQALSKQLNRIELSSINLTIIGIGNDSSLDRFSAFNRMPRRYLKVAPNNQIHQELKLSQGLSLPIHPVLNLMLMCMGFKSTNTLKEVLRGYVGDFNGDRLFSSEEYIEIFKIKIFKGSMFNIFGNRNCLRPFELATKRLINMIEILTHWKVYLPDAKYICQRGATYIFDKNGQLLYNYKSNSLLGYSLEMTKPLAFLDKFLI